MIKRSCFTFVSPSLFLCLILLVIQELECVLKMWLQLSTNDRFLLFLSLSPPTPPHPLFSSLNQAGICGTCWLSTAAQVDILCSPSLFNDTQLYSGSLAKKQQLRLDIHSVEILI